MTDRRRKLDQGVLRASARETVRFVDERNISWVCDRAAFDRVDFYEIDITREAGLCYELGMEHLPTILFCSVDKLPVVAKGAASRDTLVLTIERELLNSDQTPSTCQLP